MDTYLRIFIFFLCINVGVLAVEEAVGVDLNGQHYPNITEILDNFLVSIDEQDPFTSIGNYFYFSFELIKTLIGVLTGGYIMASIQNIYLFPDAFVYGVQVVMSFLLILQIYSFITGRQLLTR